MRFFLEPASSAQRQYHALGAYFFDGVGVWAGLTGVGKAGLPCGLLLKAPENDYRCHFILTQDLF